MTTEVDCKKCSWQESFQTYGKARSAVLDHDCLERFDESRIVSMKQVAV